jgi:beta-N-acetylglucosaminidase
VLALLFSLTGFAYAQAPESSPSPATQMSEGTVGGSVGGFVGGSGETTIPEGPQNPGELPGTDDPTIDDPAVGDPAVGDPAVGDPALDDTTEPGDDTTEPGDDVDNESEGAALVPFASITEGTIITIAFNSARTQVFDIFDQSSTAEAQLALYQANNNASQRFRVNDVGGGYYALINVRSGLALDVFGGNSATAGAAIIQWPYKGTDNQKWAFVLNGDGSYAIVSKLSPNLCIDATGGKSLDGTPLVLWTKSDNKPNQAWWISSIQRSIDDGIYTIHAASGATMLDIEGSSVTGGARALTYNRTGGINQRFILNYESSTGYYTITTVHSLMRLDVFGKGKTAGTSVIQWSDTGGFNQRWSLEPDPQSGNLLIRSAHSGLALDVFGGSANSGAQVIIWPLHGKANQQWVFEETALLGSGVYSLNVSDLAWLDVYGRSTANGAAILTWTKTGRLNQRFFVNRVADDIYTIEDLNSNKYITASEAPASDVVLYEWQNSDAQKWRLVPCGNRRFNLVSLSGNNRCLTASALSGGGNVSLTSSGSSGSPSSNATQMWQFVGAQPIDEGLYVLTSALDTTYALDIPGNSREPGVSPILWTAGEGKANQRFVLRRATGSYYYIINMNSGLALDVYGSAISATNGSGAVLQWTVKTGNPANQLWRVEYLGNGNIRFISALANERACLTVLGGQATPNAAIGTLDINGSLAQAFRPMRVANFTYESLNITLDEMTSWQCAQTGGVVYSNGVSWVTASYAQVKGLLNPAQQSDRMMQFVDLRIPTGITGAQVESYIAAGASSSGDGGRSVFRGLGATFVAAANQYGINEVYFISHAVNETGWGKYVCGDAAYQGFYYDGKTKINGQYWPVGTYYNFWGIGAYDSNALTGGQNFAVTHGWNSPSAAIYGSAKWIADNYIYAGQPTLYDMRWDYGYCNTYHSYSGHKYATDIEWPRKAARLMENMYNTTGTPELYYLVPAYR